eukprot:XP_011619995.1 PREDICTED: extracellular calcium-sensing receptor-like [Takifugu rubripes]
MLCSHWGQRSDRNLSADGDVMIGGLFNLYYIPSAVQQEYTQLPHYERCSSLDIESLKYMYTMVFAVEEINRDDSLLPGVRLGYGIRDSCFRYPWALDGALSLINGGDVKDFLMQSAGEKVVPLIIGAASSTTGIMLSSILQSLSVPIISYSASCPCLSDRAKFPTFFRTIPSDIYQARAMAQLAIRFRWTWLGAVVVNNDYGQLAIQIFQEEIRGKEMCMEFIETVNRETLTTDARRIALTIQAATARVILIFCWYIDAKEILLELAKRNITGRQFLASEALSTSEELLQELAIAEVANGVLGVAIQSSTIPGFEHFLRSLNPVQRPDDEFLKDFWEMEFSGAESLVEMDYPFPHTSKLRVAHNVYLAVYAAAHALHSLLSCPGQDSPPGKSNCSSPNHIRPIDAVVTTAVFVVFLHYRHTPMVRANNSELSFLLLLSLKLCFLCSLVFIGRPSVWSCRFQQAAFGISFVLCVSCILVKTLVVLAVFRSAQPDCKATMKWFGPSQQRGSVGLFTSIQIVICGTWLSVSPPKPERDLGFQGSKVTLECTMASVVGFSLVLGYIGLLACTCLLLAFLARKLPDNFNEAKLITFSMLIFCAVWVAFVPAYVSSPGKYVVAVEIFAILASSYGLLFCIFAPKCFIILLRPEKNTKKHLMSRNKA